MGLDEQGVQKIIKGNIPGSMDHDHGRFSHADGQSGFDKALERPKLLTKLRYAGTYSRIPVSALGNWFDPKKRVYQGPDFRLNIESIGHQSNGLYQKLSDKALHQESSFRTK